jgi:hypothetical protein
MSRSSRCVERWKPPGEAAVDEATAAVAGSVQGQPRCPTDCQHFRPLESPGRTYYQAVLPTPETLIRLLNGVDGARYTDALDRSIRGAERLLERIGL